MRVFVLSEHERHMGGSVIGVYSTRGLAISGARRHQEKRSGMVDEWYEPRFVTSESGVWEWEFNGVDSLLIEQLKIDA